MLGATLLGLASGIIGTFMLLRKRALMGDALSHATLPGIGLAFMVMAAAGGTGKYLPGLLLGAMISGAIGLGCVLAIRSWTRLKEDAALGIVLSVFFGLGVALLGIVQKMDTGSAAGLESFIYGKTASMLSGDAALIAGAAAVIALTCAALFKEFALLCFDSGYARAQGWPITGLDVVMMVLVVGVTVIGLQAVGLILMIALLVIPPAAARFWTNHLSAMVLVSGLIGALSGLLGAGFSALVPRLPAGAIIVVVGSLIFGFSLLFGPARGWLARTLVQRRLSRKVLRQNLLRAMFEYHEQAEGAAAGVAKEASPGSSLTVAELLARRAWSLRTLRRTLRAAQRDRLVRVDAGVCVVLTREGLAEAQRVVRNHRLWEIYLITHADIAPSHVDRDADELEHVLGATMVRSLEERLAEERPVPALPPSPHSLVGT
ncbi:MAG: metal ABC transporter permease [Planctomycetes bacterium]|nr:metal ABC transporter permease [Planctomycetota bacterium]